MSRRIAAGTGGAERSRRRPDEIGLFGDVTYQRPARPSSVVTRAGTVRIAGRKGNASSGGDAWRQGQPRDTCDSIREIAIKIRIRRLVWQLPYPKARSGRPI
ncbi:hypothetical protein FRACA_600025 [Frankia canadensis]|uniref:Uncharacterized protein n=1 Tax=Frankia canadensis TaxID=1836972 RepID=A0A2I2KZL8_9ACTN|nr:hypothetical protein FRACA_600025 [Frankia canadensis]SOU58404.1 hypothetical protein FRACA_600025 [Frankia canadensis]